MQPGSMPAGARELFAEGLVIPPVRLTPEVERLVLANARTPAMRRGDLAAQRAAVERGGEGLRALVDRYGWAGVQRAARDLMDYAERRTRAALGRYAVAGLAATDWMEGDGVTEADLAIAVAAGNVETSQRITDAVFLALAEGGLPVPAQGQGTMNNVTLGGREWTYYETLGGGQGAGPTGPGPSGVHVGMSNTRNTPIEVVELEIPVRIRTYALRNGSGGAGKWAGGDGVVREDEALAPMEAGVPTGRRRAGAGGAPR